MKKIDGISVDKLAGQFGSPLFVVSARSLRSSIRAFQRNFSKKYPKAEIAYAYKANSILGVLDIIHKEGTWAEAASGFEYEIAKKLGVPTEKIVFNGPYKTRDELRKACIDGALINVDNAYELELLEDIVSKLGRSFDIGIRVNTAVGIHQASDRFGFNLETGEALEIVNRCNKEKLLNIVGLHIHLTSYILESGESDSFIPAKGIKLIWPKSPEMYRKAAERIVRFAEVIGKKFGVVLKYIDMGGGFPTVDYLDPYVHAITEPILGCFKRSLPVLILEPGRAIVKNAVDLITTIVFKRELANKKREIVIDAGINILPTSYFRLQEIEPASRHDDGLMDTIVYGPLCLQTDIISKTGIPDLNVGDKLLVKNVGAYNISQSSSFIFPRPSVVLIDDGMNTVLRRRETVNDLFTFELY